MSRILACSFVLIGLGCGGAVDSDLLGGGGQPQPDAASSNDATTTTNDATTTPDASTPDVEVAPDVNQPDTSPVDPGIYCGLTSSSTPKYCSVPGNYCCDNHGLFTCYPTSNSAACAASLNIECDDQSDCAGKICCGDLETAGYSYYQQVTCKTTCAGTIGTIQEIRFCDPMASTDECKMQAQTCTASTVLKGYYVCQ